MELVCQLKDLSGYDGEYSTDGRLTCLIIPYMSGWLRVGWQKKH